MTRILRALTSFALAVGLAATAEAKESDLRRIATNRGDLIVHPIRHATVVLTWSGKTFYIDPVGGAKAFESFPRPDLVLVTDIHGDHLDGETLRAVVGEATQLIVPAAVAAKLDVSLRERATVMGNGETLEPLAGIRVEATAMYNLTPDRLRYHTKGRGNGYVLSLGGRRIYFSGDTEDVPEMRALQSIDVAFVCMNLPYTMTVEQAASAVLEFRPKVVYPYHHRGSDVADFATRVESAGHSEVRQLEWYP